MIYPIVNIADPSDKNIRIVGFKLGEADKAYGQMGLSEPCFWLEKLVKKAERYDWLAEHPTATVSVYKGKYRVNIGDNVVTEWYDSRDEAIDSAMFNDLDNDK